jgi:hypothetical protein
MDDRLKLIAAAAALAVAGCGSSSHTTTTATSAATPSGAAGGTMRTGQALDALCTRADAEGRPLTTALTGGAKHDAPILAKLIAIEERYLPQLEAITPDPKLKDTFGLYIAAIEKADIDAKNLLHVARRGDDTAYQTSAEALQGEGANKRTLAQALGSRKGAQN